MQAQRFLAVVTLKPLQMDLNVHVNLYNHERRHQGKRCQGGTPMRAFMDGKNLFVGKNLDDLVAA
jgi:hypothetical protein